MTSTCEGCRSTVYPLEKVVLGDHTFHKGCAKCAECGSNLTISSFASAGERLLCKVHYMEMFKTSGGKYPTGAELKPAQATSKPSLTDFLAKEKQASVPVTSSSGSFSQPASVAVPASTPVKTAAPAPQPTPERAKTGAFASLTPAERLAMFTNSAIAQVEKNSPTKDSAPAKSSKPVVVEAPPLSAVSKPIVEKTLMEPPSQPKTKVAALASDSVAEPIKVSAAPKPPSTPVKDLATPLVKHHDTPMPSSKASTGKPSATLFKEKVAQFKSTHPNEGVYAELAEAKAKIVELENEVSGLRARLELADAGKEALVQQLLAVEKKQQHQRENIKSRSNSPASPEKALAHAKRLLDQGRISKSQYNTALKAYDESKKLVAVP